MTVTRETRPPLSPLKRLSFFQKVVAFDQDLAMICSVSSDETASLASLRPFLKLLEYSGHGIPWLFGVFVALYYFNGQNAGIFEIAFNILFALILDLIVSSVIKAVVRRPRPATNTGSDMFFVISVDHFSFPSGHATRAAMLSFMAIILSNLSVVNKYFTIVWMVCIGISRIMLGRHHISDVVCGFLIGYLQALVVQMYWFEVSDLGDVIRLVKAVD